MRDLILSIVVMSIHRGLLLRNRILGLRAPVWNKEAAPVDLECCAIPVGKGVLDATLTLPQGRQIDCAVLIMHGIGETIEHWGAVQHLFAMGGIASLVFDYRGFGRSFGWFSPDQAEGDAAAAFAYLRGRLPSRAISILGFSLGSGIAADVAVRAGADALVLCAAYPSLRKAARSIGLPEVLMPLLRDVWNTEKVLRTHTLPVVIVHGEEDRLFPPALAHNLAAACGTRCTLIVAPGVSHDDPLFRPRSAFWDPVLDRLPRAAVVDEG